MAYKEVSVKQPLLLTILPYVSIIIFFAFWEGVVRSGIIPNTLLASPSPGVPPRSSTNSATPTP